ncbi:hypothetical protein [Methylocucumis oryzae]|nr:hypothetical protein [Methylocucumis oryzae]
MLEPTVPLSAITLNNAVEYGRANNVELLGLMNQLTSALEKSRRR